LRVSAPAMRAVSSADQRRRLGSTPPPSEPDVRISRIRFSG
jgi:hypothetical protein